MLDDQYKKLIESWEVSPPAQAWNFIDKAINKPWYAKPWAKIALISSVTIVSILTLYYGLNPTTKNPNPQVIPASAGNTDNSLINNSNKKSSEKTTSNSIISEENSKGSSNNAVIKENQEKHKTINRAKEDKLNPVVSSTTTSGSSNKAGTDVNKSKSNSGSQTNNTPINNTEKYNSIATLRLSSDAVCVNKVITIKAEGISSDCILDFGDNQRINLASGKTVVPYSYTNAGIYTISILQKEVVLISKQLIVDAKVQAFFKTDITENTSVQFTNLSLAASKFIWYFDDGKTETSTDKNTVVHFYTSTSHLTFKVKLIALNPQTGCCDTFVTEVKNPNFKNYFFTVIPNVFTPNNDGMNDVFEIPASELKEWHIIIYNESGQLVFESNKQQNHWNGRINNVGNECSKGTYRYIIKYMQPDDDEMHQKTGFITLIRE